MFTSSQGLNSSQCCTKPQSEVYVALYPLQDCDTKRYACPICEELGVSGKTYSLDDMDQMDTNYFLVRRNVNQLYSETCQIYRETSLTRDFATLLAKF